MRTEVQAGPYTIRGISVAGRLECTFVDEHRSIEDAHERAHVHATVQAKLPPRLRERLKVFAPEAGRWFG